MSQAQTVEADANSDCQLYSINEAAQRLGLGRTGIYSLIAERKLKTVRIGRRRLVARKALEEFVAGLTD
jgi:excisionase family DNA binding protein